MREVGESAKYVAAFGWDAGEEGVRLPEAVGVRIEHLVNLEGWIWGGQEWSRVV